MGHVPRPTTQRADLGADHVPEPDELGSDLIDALKVAKKTDAEQIAILAA